MQMHLRSSFFLVIVFVGVLVLWHCDDELCIFACQTSEMPLAPMRCHIIWMSNEIPSVMFMDCIAFVPCKLLMHSWFYWWMNIHTCCNKTELVRRTNVPFYRTITQAICFSHVNHQMHCWDNQWTWGPFPQIMLFGTVILYQSIPRQKSDTSCFISFYFIFPIWICFHFLEVECIWGSLPLPLMIHAILIRGF